MAGVPVVTADGSGVVSHAGTALLAELADRFGLTAAYREAMYGVRRRGGGHDSGRVLVDIAAAIADGAETITDLRVLADQLLLHGSVVSTAAAWRVMAAVDEDRLDQLRRARAVARERVWLARGELAGIASDSSSEISCALKCSRIRRPVAGTPCLSISSDEPSARVGVR